MAFPTTSVLTSFTGADEDPLSEGGNWAGPIRNAQRQAERFTNAARHSANPDNTVSGTSYWTVTQYGPNVEVFATVPELPSSTHGVSVWARIHNPGNATTMEAYLGVYTTDTGFRIFKVTAGATFAQIGSTDATVASAGDKIGLEVIGTSLTLYHFTSGSWVSRVTGTDSAITGSGYIGLEFSSNITAGTLDDFGGGTHVASPPRSQYLDYDYSRS